MNCELKTLWERVLGELPSGEQFAIWGELFPTEIIRKGFTKTAIKNQTLGGTMSLDHKLRFATRVMQTAVKDAAANAKNRECLRQEFEGVTR